MLGGMNRLDASTTASVPSGETDAKAVSTQETVERIAKESRDRADFLHRLAMHLAATFDAAVVAVQDSTFPQPRMLVRDESIAARLDRDRLRVPGHSVSGRMRNRMERWRTVASAVCLRSHGVGCRAFARATVCETRDHSWLAIANCANALRDEIAGRNFHRDASNDERDGCRIE